MDADTLGLADLLVRARPDVTYPGFAGGVFRKRFRQPPCPITSPDVNDEDWLPVVGSEGWLVITRDKAIQRRPGEKQSVLDHNVRMVAITSDENLTVFEQLEVVMTRWREIEVLEKRLGPFIYALTRTGPVRRVL